MGDIIRPFLKWAGGKSRLARHLASLYHDRIERYVEPFLGSGALFLYLAQSRPRFPAMLSDSNAELVQLYKCIRDSPVELIEVLEEHQRRYYGKPEEYYYRVRDEHKHQSIVEKAARMIFLNKTCYNGLYRVNKSGEFNVPHGTYVRPLICNRHAIIGGSAILNRSGISIRCADYGTATACCRPGDLVYFDPPYLPLTRTANFTDYTSKKFGYNEHVALAREFRRLANLGCTVLLSNSNSPAVKELYEGFTIRTLDISRSINCKANKRIGQSELVISSMPMPIIRKLRPPERRALPISVPQMS